MDNLDNLPNQGEACVLELVILAEKMCEDGRLKRDEEGGPSNFRVFTKHKVAFQGALIAHLWALNWLRIKPSPTWVLCFFSICET